MRLIVYLKASTESLELSRRCDSSPRDKTAGGFLETARAMREANETHVLNCKEMVKKIMPGGARLEALPGMHVLIVDCPDSQAYGLRRSIQDACDQVVGIGEDVEMELIA